MLYTFFYLKVYKPSCKSVPQGYPHLDSIFSLHQDDGFGNPLFPEGEAYHNATLFMDSDAEI